MRVLGLALVAAAVPDVCPGSDDALDADGDGTPDGCETVRWAADVPIAAVHAPTGIDVADLDSDGYPDVLAIWYCQGGCNGRVSWIENLGGGAWAVDRVIDEPPSLYESELTTGDLDGDGDPDVITTNSGRDNVSWYPNLGGGSFGLPVVVETGHDGASGCAVADLDGDGALALAVTGIYADDVRWLGSVGSVVTGPTVLATGLDRAGQVLAGDLDGDGDMDLAVRASTADAVVWLEGLVGGVFGPAVQIDGPSDPEDLAMGDIDGDGDPDLVVAALGAGKVFAYLNVGGVWLKQTALVTPSPLAVGLADIDNDGDLDLAVAPNIGPAVVAQNDGSGNFFEPRTFLPNTLIPHHVRAADVDLDGDLDLVVADENKLQVDWIENLGRDTDGDGLADLEDICPLDPTNPDVDGDGVCDSAPVVATDTGGGAAPVDTGSAPPAPEDPPAAAAPEPAPDAKAAETSCASTPRPGPVAPVLLALGLLRRRRRR
jgi:hypothetical protein